MLYLSISAALLSLSLLGAIARWCQSRERVEWIRLEALRRQEITRADVDALADTLRSELCDSYARLNERLLGLERSRALGGEKQPMGPLRGTGRLG